MKRHVLLLSAFTGLVVTAPADVLPLTENRWDNPAFVAAFTGSYGFDSEKNPSITAEEKKFFETLSPVIQANPAQAITMVQAVLTPASSAALDYTLANLYFQSGKTAEAIQAYEATLKKFPNFTRAHKNLGMLYVQQGKFDLALPELLVAVQSGGMDGASLGLVGYVYLNLGKTASALDAYRLSLIFEPTSRDWRLGKAQCLLQIGENKEAVAMIDEMLGEQPNQTDLLLLQANAFLADGQADKAAANIQIVRALGKASAESLVLLGDIFVNGGNSDIAVDAYNEALEKGGLSADRQLRIVRVLVSRGAWNDADAVLAKIRSTSADKLPETAKVDLLNLEAQTALGKNDDARAAQILESVVAKDPLNGRAILLLADYHAKKGDIERAELYYTRAASVAETETDALIQHARMLVGRRDFARAAQLLARAQGLRPQPHVAAYLAKVEAAAAAVR